MTFLGVVLMLAFLLVAFVLVAAVLLQEGKGGGLTGMAAGMDGVMGARNPLRKVTAWAFVIFVLLVVGINKYFDVRAKRAAVLPEVYEPSGGEIPLPPPTTPTGTIELPGAAGPDIEIRTISPEEALGQPEAPTPEGDIPAAPEAPGAPAAPEAATPEPAAPEAETAATPAS